MADSFIHIVNNQLNTEGTKYVMTVSLNFYQLWSLFGMLPTLRPRAGSKRKTNKKMAGTKYEWKLQCFKNGCTSSVWSIYDWNNKNKLLQTNEWHIATNATDTTEIKAFLEHFMNAIMCYNKYYKCIENNVYTSNIPEVQMCLQMLQYELLAIKMHIENV